MKIVLKRIDGVLNTLWNGINLLVSLSISSEVESKNLLDKKLKRQCLKINYADSLVS